MFGINLKDLEPPLSNVTQLPALKLSPDADLNTVVDTFPDLRFIRFYQVTDDQLIPLPRCTRLTEVWLSACMPLTDLSLQIFSTLPLLSSLYLWLVSGFTDVGVGYLTSLT